VRHGRSGLLSGFLCALAEIADPGAKGPFIVEHGGARLTVFVVRRGAEAWGWVDSCPHAGAPLEMEPDGFLDLARDHILCSLHGARFEMDSGLCVAGPCRGHGLKSYPVHIRNGMVTGGRPTEGL
jgi:Ferredoxin subunits of nitrite reductase and ring-hydroxylating dioxygenases